jgi:hypothetical protein
MAFSSSLIREFKDPQELVKGAENELYYPLSLN